MSLYSGGVRQLFDNSKYVDKNLPLQPIPDSLVSRQFGRLRYRCTHEQHVLFDVLKNSIGNALREHHRKSQAARPFLWTCQNPVHAVKFASNSTIWDDYRGIRILRPSHQAKEIGEYSKSIVTYKCAGKRGQILEANHEWKSIVTIETRQPCKLMTTMSLKVSSFQESNATRLRRNKRFTKWSIR